MIAIVRHATGNHKSNIRNRKLNMIFGVEFKELVTHYDERGYFREVIRTTDPFFNGAFGQWSHAKSFQGSAKAWHVHAKQTDWWYCPIGIVKCALYDTRADSPTFRDLDEFFLGESDSGRVVKIPPGVAHGYKVVEGPAHLFYLTSSVYDPADEGRIPHDSPEIGYDWTKGPAIK